MQIRFHRPWIDVDLGGPHQVLSWAVNRPGLVTASRILWREVRNADLTPGLDVEDWLAGELRSRQASDAVVMLTSRDTRFHHHARAEVGDSAVECLATVGLSNAERIGCRRPPESRNWGTINLAVQIRAGLTAPALIEALSIATEARTLAVIEAEHLLPEGPATGTGTDCIALAAPEGAVSYAGLHTELGEAVGRAVYQAVTEGALGWAVWLREELARRR